jgi:hypothetical protein
LGAIAPASMRGLRHKVRHKNREGFVEWNANGAGPFAARTTEFLDKLWLKVHAAKQVGETRLRVQRAADEPGPG